MRFTAWVSLGVWVGIGALVAGGDARGDVETARSAEISIGERFDALRKSYGGLTYPQLEQKLKLREPASDGRLTFDPTRVKYFKEIRRALAFSPEEERIYRKTGMVSVDHGQRYSMASSYLAIFRNDLPVLITVDSILHAMHRSFDAMLVELETEQISPAMEKILAAAHERLKAEAAKSTRPSDAAKDADLYLTVARNLLADPLTPAQRIAGTLNAKPGEPNCDNPAYFSTAECRKAAAARLARGLQVSSLFGQDAAVRSILANVVALTPTRLSIYGGQREVDWSQFKPRGHYANSPALRRYFEAMMWLGRADLGFHLSPPAPGTGLVVDVGRERADAVVLTDLLRGAGQLGALGGIDRLLAYLVGPSDNASPAQVAAALAGEGDGGLARLSDRAVAERVVARLSGGRQEILSQMMYETARGAGPPPLPALFQLFGQRFVIDSFVMSKIAGAITSRRSEDDRAMPSGLDVAAALGDDEAVRLRRPELERYGYSASLLAARTLARELPAAAWDATAYDVWLDALSNLSRPLDRGAPQVMHSAVWRRKELQTQLASWAELRHDTILYAKQSYSHRAICEYPAGYVEPYPKVFARVAFFADELARRFAKLGVSNDRMKTFLGTFSSRVRQLQALAEKELAGRPFTREEKQFVKDAIHLKTESHGCGGPTNVYTGWYPTLLYNGSPESWEPTVADVHTDPDHGQVLEVGVGDVDFLVVAIDNGSDRAAYVGPAYSYYEFASGDRLTDEDWRAKLKSGHPPARPAWVGAFQAGVRERSILPPPVNPKADAGPVANPLDAGALSLPAFYAGIQTVSRELWDCGNRFKLDTHLAVEIEITPSGRVRRVTVTVGVAPPAAERCLKEVIGKVQFERSEHGLRVPYSIVGM